MNQLQFEIGDIAELATPVAMHGALRAADVSGSDDMFELIVGIAIVLGS